MKTAKLIKTPEEIAAIKEGGLLLSGILGELVAMVRPGITTGELDAQASDGSVVRYLGSPELRQSTDGDATIEPIEQFDRDY